MKKCELLVPVGGREQMIAAVENGADAVYLGGRQFNARINAGNFDNGEMTEAVDFAHKRGVKVYVTMNTLLTDEELPAALEYAAFLYETGVDALIIQDLGFGSLVREYLSDFPIHLSTQGTVYDLRGVEAAYRLGYERVVLARELSLEEIRHICANTQAEIEVFVHGALCVCYSGQCQMSRYFGGRSGNRGQCAQPCRLPYKTLDEDSRLVSTFKHPLSPKDLCTIDHIGQLAEAGVASLKIEGRMKSPEYVSVVTSVYRKYLDLYYEKGGYTVDEQDRRALEQIFNRGGFTSGYLFGNPGDQLMSGIIPKHRGVRIGKVVKSIQGTSLIDVKLYEPLALGDGVEIQGQSVTGNVVTYYKELKGGLTRIGDIKGQVSPGDPLYKITSKEQIKLARQTFEHKTYGEGKYQRKTPVDMTFECGGDGVLRLSVKSPLLADEVSAAAGPFELDGGKAMDRQRVEKALRKTGNTPFTVRNIEISGAADKNIQVSLINDIRRKALNLLEDRLVFRREKVDITLPENLSSGRGSAWQEGAEPGLELYFYDWDSFASYQMPDWLAELSEEPVYLIPAAELLTHAEELSTCEAGPSREALLSRTEELPSHAEELSHAKPSHAEQPSRAAGLKQRRIIPYITSVSKGREDRIIEEHFDRLCSLCRDTGIYAGNLSWLAPFAEAGVTVWGDYGLNVYNEKSREVYRSLGAADCVPGLEALEKGFGAFPLMISEHSPWGSRLIDRKKEKISIVKRAFSDQILLVPETAELRIQTIKTALSEGRKKVRIYYK